MPKHLPNDTENRRLAIAAARFRSDGLNQLEIAQRLQKSQPEISRLLAYAQTHRYLASAPAFLAHNVNEDDGKEVDRRFFSPEAVRRILGGLAPEGLHLNVQVLPDKEEEFARAAAGCVARLLQRAKRVGVMWGRTVRGVVVKIEEHRELFTQTNAGLRCIPLCGDPVHLMNKSLAEYSASQLAAELGRAINPGQKKNSPCLLGVPAYLSSQLARRRAGATAEWRQFVEGIPGYRAIFEGSNDPEEPCVNNVEAILTGMGIIVLGKQTQRRDPGAAAYEEMGDFIQERLEQEELSAEQLSQLIYGDIGGWLLEREGLSAADRRRVEDLNRGWTGVKGNDFARVARAAKPNGAPGVIVVAAGKAKAEMVRQVVKRGLVNELLIDSTLSTALQA